jgi:hypothetical protein
MPPEGVIPTWLARPYRSIGGFLHRWTVASAWRLTARLHNILKPDGTPFLHGHPDSYVTVMLRGWYEEELLLPDGSLRRRTVRPGRIAVRRASQMHRISALSEGGCWTLFLAYRHGGTGPRGWGVARHPAVAVPADYWEAPEGVYEFRAGGFRMRKNGVWHCRNSTPEAAASDERYSINQDIYEVDTVGPFDERDKTPWQ